MTSLPRSIAVACMLALASACTSHAQTVDTVCRKIEHERTAYTVCEIDLARHVVRTYWKRADGRLYGSIAGLASALHARGRRPLVVMNAGMFKPDRSPLGLYVEDGREIVPVNAADGDGNFFMKPNGIFYVRGESAGVIETERFLREMPEVDFATQSGPMLMIDGKLHPAIAEHGTSKHVRNGVCVRDKRVVVLAISRRTVSFGELARLFRDRMGCSSALYLDGKVSGVVTSETLPKRFIVPVGPLLAALPR